MADRADTGARRLPDLTLLARKDDQSDDPRFLYVKSDGKLYVIDQWAIRGYDDLGQPR